MYDRPFDGRLKEVCIRQEESDLRMIAIANPDYIPVNLREEGSRLIRPTPKAEYHSMSDSEYKTILIEYKVTENPPDTFGITGNSQQTKSANSLSETSKSTVGYAGLGAIPTVPKSTTNFISTTENKSNRIIEFYGTDNWSELEIMAKKYLKIDKPKNIIKIEDRVKNFDKFVIENFIDNSKHHTEAWPANMKSSVSYGLIKQYALTEYGAISIKMALDDNPSRLLYDDFVSEADFKNKDEYNQKYRFQVRHTNDSPQAGYNHMSFPLSFPNGKPFSGGELKDPLAIIHHEFGHTRFYSGQSKAVKVTLKHERKSIIENSNPVRILNGFEPRYTYTHTNGKSTINILTGKEETHAKDKGYTIKKDDPNILMLRGTKGAFN